MTSDARHRMVAMLPRLRAFALSLTRRRNEADDLVQATCERALGALHTFQEGTNFDAWLLRILRNLWIDGFRRTRDETLVDSTDPRYDGIGEDGRDTVEARSRLNAVWRFIGNLPEEQRSVLVLVCVEGLSYRESAEVLDVPVGTVMSRLARARQGLTAAIETGGGGGEDVPSARRQAGDRS